MISFDRTRDDRQRCQHGNPRLLFYSRRKRVKAKNVVRLRVLKAETRKGLEDPRGRSHRCSTTHRALRAYVSCILFFAEKYRRINYNQISSISNFTTCHINTETKNDYWLDCSTNIHLISLQRFKYSSTVQSRVLLRLKLAEEKRAENQSS